jgi:predicted Rossmann fold nucleotide-binding protein DprA/Smf involved in DNA uptake
MGKNGGAAITVAFALNGNKDIAAAPFEAGDPEAANNELIRNGATLVDDAVAFLTETFLGQN